MKKLSARWELRLLVIDQKRIWMNVSEECLDMLKRNSTEFLRWFITTDETSIYHYMPETKQQSKQWVEVLQKSKNSSVNQKMMATVFWDSNSVDHFERRLT